VVKTPCGLIVSRATARSTLSVSRFLASYEEMRHARPLGPPTVAPCRLSSPLARKSDTGGGFFPGGR
jgi:hypothetical protein